MATATTSFGLTKPSTSFLLPRKSLDSFSTTVKFRTPFRPTTACSITNRLTDSSKPLNAATATCTSSSTSTIPVANGKLISRYAPDEPRKGVDVLVEALERAGVTVVFDYPGGATMEIHESLTRSFTGQNIVCRHQQGEIFAAEGYACVSGKLDVCIATSGPGATNLASGLAEALRDNVSSVSITCQVPRCSATHQQQPVVPTWDKPMEFHGYFSLPPKAHLDSNLDQILPAISESKKPVLYVGGGCLNSSAELGRFLQLTGIPVASTLKGLGTYPLNYPLSLGMHGTVYANYAMQEADLLLAFGVRFDDRVTRKLEEFAGRAKIVHIDIDPAEIGKNKQPHISVCADLENSLDKMNKLLEERIDSIGKLDFSAWIEELMEQKKKCTLWFNMLGKAIPKEYERKVLDELIIVGVITAIKERQHQMRAAQEYGFKGPRQWATISGIVPVPAANDLMWASQCYGRKSQVVELGTSCGLWAMGFGLRAAKYQMWAAQLYRVKAQVFQLGTSSGLKAMGFGLHPSKHQMWAAQGYGFKDQSVELCTSSGLGAMGFGLHVAKHQMWATQGYSFKAELGTSSGLRAMGVGFLAAQDQMWAAQGYGFKGPQQFAISSGLGAVGFGLPAAIVVCVAQKKGNPFLWIKKNKGVKLGIICLEMVELFQFIRKKLGIIFPEIVELFQTGP